jgi:hypothetical protein
MKALNNKEKKREKQKRRGSRPRKKTNTEAQRTQRTTEKRALGKKNDKIKAETKELELISSNIFPSSVSLDILCASVFIFLFGLLKEKISRVTIG